MGTPTRSQLRNGRPPRFKIKSTFRRSLAEAPIAATLPDGHVVAGTVDRLLVERERVRVVDFKTGRQVPRDPAEVPEAHRRQMEAYGQALAVIFPDKRIETALLYTAGPRLIDLGG